LQTESQLHLQCSCMSGQLIEVACSCELDGALLYQVN